MQTPNGLRGAVALETIDSGELMICIPQNLLISEESCLNHQELKTVFAENSDVFTRDDPVITLYLVHEMALGETSFFYPYLSILPYPETLQDWTEEELLELGDRYERERKVFYLQIWLLYLRRVYVYMVSETSWKQLVENSTRSRFFMKEYSKDLIKSIL